MGLKNLGFRIYEQSLLNLAFVSIQLYTVAWALASGVIHALTKIRFAHPSCYAGPEQTHQVSAFPGTSESFVHSKAPPSLSHNLHMKLSMTQHPRCSHPLQLRQ